MGSPQESRKQCERCGRVQSFAHSLAPSCCGMAFTPEQKCAYRAERKRARAAEDASCGIKRRPRGGKPLWHRWDLDAGAWVLDEDCVPPAEQPPLPPQPADLNAWAAANPPPRRQDFESQQQFDDLREPWYATLMGAWLPPYGQNAARVKAWGRALKRQTERTSSHEYAQARAVKERNAHDREAEHRQAAEAQRQAEQELADAPLKEQLADCERRNNIGFHASCGQWHHERVPCADAHKWPRKQLWPKFKEWSTGTMFIEGVGAVKGDRTPEECMWEKGQCTGTIHGKLLHRCDFCVPPGHRLSMAHRCGRHVPGEYVFEY